MVRDAGRRAKPMKFEELDWNTLDRLRSVFLEGVPVRSAYWKAKSDLASYDETYGERIAWKWDAVLGELAVRRWTPPAGVLLDFGCGSGIAGRRVARICGMGHFSRIHFHDRSALAEAYSVERAQGELAGIEATCGNPDRLFDDGQQITLVVSHVLNELPERERKRLIAVADRAAAILWVEPGSRAVSRDLIEIREHLRHATHIVAPCTCPGACGLLRPENERHWCHFFAPPPPNLGMDSDWARFARRAGIDLRSIPYSFLVTDRRPVDVASTGQERILGVTRQYKGYSKLHSCGADGVRELTLQHRDDPGLAKMLATDPSIAEWNLEGGRIRSGKIISAAPILVEPTREVEGGVEGFPQSETQ